MVDARQSFHHRQRAATLIDLKKFDEAAREARRALEQNPDSVETHRLLAWALWQQGKLDEAERPARKALGLAPNNAECHSTLALILSHQGRHEEAETHYQKAVALAPRIHVFHCRYAGFCLRTGQWEDALEKADEALRLAPRDVESLTVRADALCRLGRLAGCRSEAGRAPTPGRIRQNRGEPAAWEPPPLGSPTAC
jgi:Flp pilus assembly protein TadD